MFATPETDGSWNWSYEEISPIPEESFSSTASRVSLAGCRPIVGIHSPVYFHLRGARIRSLLDVRSADDAGLDPAGTVGLVDALRRLRRPAKNPWSDRADDSTLSFGFIGDGVGRTSIGPIAGYHVGGFRTRRQRFDL